MQCDFGCGQEAIFDIGKKKCCSDNVSRCPAIRERIRQSRLGKVAWNKGKKIGPSPFKGKKYTDIHGLQESEIVKSRISAALKGKRLGCRTGSTQEIENNRREKIRQSILARYEQGWQPKAGRCKKIMYESPYAGLVRLDGTWELEVAQFLDSKQVNWRRNRNRFHYEYENKNRFYTPDFCLVDLNLYIEVKGYITDKDRAKWSQFPYLLSVWQKKEISAIKKSLAEDWMDWPQWSGAADC